jgi:hypothetical protein
VGFHLAIISERRRVFRSLLKGQSFDERVVNFIAQNLGSDTAITDIINVAKANHGTWLPEIGKIISYVYQHYGMHVPVGNINYRGQKIADLDFNTSDVLKCESCIRAESAACRAEGFLPSSPACNYHQGRQ